MSRTTHHLVVVDLEEGVVENLDRIHVIAGCERPHCVGDTREGVAVETVAARILTQLLQHGAYEVLDRVGQAHSNLSVFGA